ncbi:hypothetical protein CHS0354_031169 [Potamilus streckersoni]|uniref:Uncharacterized protein n=1 Tax=Potamilus streckersoni TaxID=2493646 RepID=A0AAE0TLI0_9BIVA|nr:hypothetical protein CHS0354_031169 [Potamilus streckersoni]
MLRKHHLDDEGAEISRYFSSSRFNRKELVLKLRASSGEQQQFVKDKPACNSESEENNQSVDKDLGRRGKFEGDDKENTNEKTNGPDTYSRNKDNEVLVYIQCLGDISAVGIGDMLTLIGLIIYGLPFIGFAAGGIVAGSLPVKIMANYGGDVASGGVVSVLKSVAMAGIG